MASKRKDPAAVKLGRKGGKKGGKARMASMTKAERQAFARLGVLARKRKRKAAKLILYLP